MLLPPCLTLLEKAFGLSMCTPANFNCTLRLRLWSSGFCLGRDPLSLCKTCFDCGQWRWCSSGFEFMTHFNPGGFWAVPEHPLIGGRQLGWTSSAKWWHIQITGTFVQLFVFDLQLFWCSSVMLLWWTVPKPQLQIYWLCLKAGSAPGNPPGRDEWWNMQPELCPRLQRCLMKVGLDLILHVRMYALTLCGWQKILHSNLFCKDFKDVCIFHDLLALTVEETTSFLLPVWRLYL